MGEKIKTLRNQNNMSQDDLAEALNCNREKLSRYENDRIHHPDMFFIYSIAQLFNVSMDYFLD